MDANVIKSALAIAIGAIGTGFDVPRHLLRAVRGIGKAPRNPFGPRNHNKFLPHQSRRECIRRRGGAELAAYRRASRLHRGLPPTKES